LSFIPDPELSENDKDHYEEFEIIYGKPASERFCLSAMNITINNEISETRPGHDVTLMNDKEIKLQATLNSLSYSCESQLLLEDHKFSEHLSVRLNFTFDSPIKSTYFSWRLKRLDICYWCRESKNLIEPSDILKFE
ncbi:17033_t:CDS:2, partial [Cetraspora pellucida]